MFYNSDTKGLVALGSNLPGKAGSPARILAAAVAEMARIGCEIVSRSHCYITPCFPVGAGPDYVNAVVAVRADMSPENLLERLHKIEADFGRLREVRWSARGLDLDLLAWGDQVAPDEETFRHWNTLPLSRQSELAPGELVLPHPRLQDRAFVLVPMADVAPDWVHPVLGLTVQQMLDALPPEDRAGVTQLPAWAAP